MYIHRHIYKHMYVYIFEYVRQAKSECKLLDLPGCVVAFGMQPHKEWVIWGYTHNSPDESLQKYSHEVRTLYVSEKYLHNRMGQLNLIFHQSLRERKADWKILIYGRK